MPSSQFRIGIVNSREVYRKLEQLNPAKNRQILRGSLLETAIKIQRDAAKNQILAGGGGLKRGKKGRKSRYTTPPHAIYLTSRTGTLRRSIKVDRAPLPFAIEVGTDLKYGAAHEFGSKKRHLHARPFMQPALDRFEPQFSDIVIKHWEKAMRKMR